MHQAASTKDCTSQTTTGALGQLPWPDRARAMAVGVWMRWNDCTRRDAKSTTHGSGMVQSPHGAGADLLGVWRSTSAAAKQAGAALFVVVALAVLIVSSRPRPAPQRHVDEGLQIRLKMAELSERLERIKQPLARCRDASTLTPLPPGRWCFHLGLADCEVHSVRPARGDNSIARLCIWNAGDQKCEARPAAGLLCNPTQLVATNSKCKALTALGGGALPRFIAVVSHWDEDVSWTDRLPMPALVYEHRGPANNSVALPAAHSVPSNHGREASAYLQFIVDHYTCLPPWLLFLHGHGSTPTHRTAMAVPGAKTTAGRERRHHPLEPEDSSALLDVDRLDRGFVAVGHYSSKDWAKLAPHPGTDPNAHQHVLGFVAANDARAQCRCDTLQQLFANESFDCNRVWAYPLGGTFWAHKRRVRHRPLPFWRNALRITLSTEHSATPVSRCFASLWHFLFGEPLHNYQPPYASFEQLPLVSKASRQQATRQRIAQAKAGRLPHMQAALAAASTCGGSGPACTQGAQPRGEDQWCPRRCANKETEEVESWLRESGFELSNPWAPKRTKRPQEPLCDLCSSRSVFIVSAGGRTGSTSLLSMLQAHPSLWIAGENSDQLGSTLRLWVSAAVQDDASVGAWKREPVDAKNLLCNVQQWFRRIAPGGPADAIRGFKEIRWGAVPIPLEPFMKWRLRNASASAFMAGAREKVRFLADLLFPCSKVIFVIREDSAALLRSMQRNWRSDDARIQSLFDEAIRAKEEFRKLHREWHATGKAWHSFWLPLEEFGTGGPNRLLEWLGETGCRFAGAVHYNRQGFEGQPLDAIAKVHHARAKLQGKCVLRAQSGAAFLPPSVENRSSSARAGPVHIARKPAGGHVTRKSTRSRAARAGGRKGAPVARPSKAKTGR